MWLALKFNKTLKEEARSRVSTLSTEQRYTEPNLHWTPVTSTEPLPAHATCLTTT